MRPRARRLPDRQSHLSPGRTAHSRGARLGAVDARASARGLCLSCDELPDAAAHRRGAWWHRSAHARHSVRGRVYRRLLRADGRSEEHTSELQSLMRISYAVFCLKKKTRTLTAATPA